VIAKAFRTVAESLSENSVAKRRPTVKSHIEIFRAFCELARRRRAPSAVGAARPARPLENFADFRGLNGHFPFKKRSVVPPRAAQRISSQRPLTRPCHRCTFLDDECMDRGSAYAMAIAMLAARPRRQIQRAAQIADRLVKGAPQAPQGARALRANEKFSGFGSQDGHFWLKNAPKVLSVSPRVASHRSLSPRRETA
jgi:hypothetical protein